MSIGHWIGAPAAARLIVGLAACLGIIGSSPAFGQMSHGGGMGGRHGSAGKQGKSDSTGKKPFVPPPSQLYLTPHGGQFLTTEANRYEIVVMPYQTRIYLYDKALNPLSARDVHAQMSVQLADEGPGRRIAFGYVSPPAGAAEQDYVAAGFDATQLPEKETPIMFEFSQLADRRHPTASFTPSFSRAKIRPYVAQVLLTDLDRDGVARQGACPVTGAPLGSTGQVVKVLIDQYPLYLSSEECIAAVKQTPERFLPPPAAPVAGR